MVSVSSSGSCRSMIQVIAAASIRQRGPGSGAAADTTPENASNSNGLRDEAEVMDGNEQAGSAIMSGLQG